MTIRTRITTEARVRGLTAAELAKRLGWYRSNISAMDAGRRSVSLRTLARLSEVLGCSPGELLEMNKEQEHPLFRQAKLNQRLIERDQRAVDGLERGWVNAVQLAWLRHYRHKDRG
ncbi:MAG: XRE family transcriptional regulator [Candidatus Omnitrophica bacterium]|nr:XRE family transcriptional regulator [Candidatus Omnitrophota bacterium]MBI3010727.1 XRE family transcriptional regulator [Candidatus Omnitrophota bacterium]